MNPQMKECPFCKEAIKAEAVKCRFCGEFLEVPKAGVATEEADPSSTSPTPSQSGLQARPQDPADATESISPDEELATIRLSKICMIRAFLKLSVIVVIFGGIAVALRLNPKGWEFLHHRMAMPINYWVNGTIIAIAHLIFAFRYLTFRARVYRVGIDRIECREGLFSRTVNNIETWRVQDVKLEQPFLQRLFGAGTVIIESTDPSEPHLEVGPIGNAEENFQVIRRFAREADKRRGVVHFDQ